MGESNSGTGEGRTLRLPWHPLSVGQARREIVADLEARGVARQTVEEAELVTSELVSNALRHARPLLDDTVRVRWRARGEVVEVEVSDGGGTTVPRPAPPAVWTAAGRGLRIVRSLAHEWGVQEDKRGQTVWAALGGPSRRRAT